MLAEIEWAMKGPPVLFLKLPAFVHETVASFASLIVRQNLRVGHRRIIPQHLVLDSFLRNPGFLEQRFDLISVPRHLLGRDGGGATDTQRWVHQEEAYNGTLCWHLEIRCGCRADAVLVGIRPGEDVSLVRAAATNFLDLIAVNGLTTSDE